MRIARGVAAAVVACGLVLGSAVGASADAGVVADSVAAAPAQAAKKKTKSANAFAKQIVLKAQKRAKKQVGGLKIVSAPGYNAGFKVTKKQRWWVGVEKPNLKYSFGERNLKASEAKAYRAALVATLKKAGLKNVGRSDGHALPVTAFAGKKYLCSLESFDRQRHQTEALSCITRKQGKAAVERMTPIVNAYLKSPVASNKLQRLFNYTKLKDVPSKNKKYSKYRRAELSLSAPGAPMGGGYAALAKAPGKKWVFVTTIGGGPECRVAEKTRTASRAWSGMPCWVAGGDGRKVKAH